MTLSRPSSRAQRSCLFTNQHQERRSRVGRRRVQERTKRHSADSARTFGPARCSPPALPTRGIRWTLRGVNEQTIRKNDAEQTTRARDSIPHSARMLQLSFRDGRAVPSPYLSCSTQLCLFVYLSTTLGESFGEEGTTAPHPRVLPCRPFVASAGRSEERRFRKLRLAPTQTGALSGQAHGADEESCRELL